MHLRSRVHEMNEMNEMHTFYPPFPYKGINPFKLCNPANLEIFSTERNLRVTLKSPCLFSYKMRRDYPVLPTPHNHNSKICSRMHF